ncbi:hypothetical protein VNI00_017502 [Paramarasmius palmivorus]|uniref:Uncharacterized protein n=1 Tax=Paramarasmius palmivorus TaxID=297713 RepID=A0AAW0B5H1_9AGAR
MSWFSVPEGAPEWDKYRCDDYKDFGRKWCSWARAVHAFEENQSNGNSDTPSSNNDTAILNPVAGPLNSVNDKANKTRKKKAKSLEDMDLDDDEEDELESSSTESSSDDGSTSEEELSSSPSSDESEEEAEDRMQARLLQPLPKGKGKAKVQNKEPKVPVRSSARLVQAKVSKEGNCSPAPQLDASGLYRLEADDCDDDGPSSSKSTLTPVSPVHDPEPLPMPVSPTSSTEIQDANGQEQVSGKPRTTPAADPLSPSMPTSSSPQTPTRPSSLYPPVDVVSPAPHALSVQPQVRSDECSPATNEDHDVEEDEDQMFRYLWSDIKTGRIGDSNYPLEACDVDWIRSYAGFLSFVPPGFAAERPKELIDCIYLWIMVEERWHGVVPHNALPQGRCVDGLAYWFKAHRVKMTKPPSEVKLEQIRDQFWAWLEECSPEWMDRDSKHRLLPSGAAGDGDFEDLVCPGTSGIVLVLVALRWWCDVGGATDKAGFWYEAARCVHTLLAGLLITPFLGDMASRSTTPISAAPSSKSHRKQNSLPPTSATGSSSKRESRNATSQAKRTGVFYLKR